MIKKATKFLVAFFVDACLKTNTYHVKIGGCAFRYEINFFTPMGIFRKTNIAV